MRWCAALVCMSCFAGEPRQDTARLAQHLGRFRAYKVYELSAVEFKSIQTEYLAWVDSRFRTGVTVDAMNEELRAADLLSDGPKTLDDRLNRTYAGYLGPVEIQPTSGAGDLLAVRLGIYTGGFCNFDETVVLYQRKPLRRIAWLNAEPSYKHGFELSSLTVGKDDAARGRLLASAWFASNCASDWNGGRIRIDRVLGPSLVHVLNRSLNFRNSDNVRIDVTGDQATFRYSTLMGETDVLEREGIASYRIQSGRLVRMAPIAATFGGFISEWLEMDDNEAARWSTPEAARLHHTLVANFKKENFEWEHAAVCPDPPAAREIGIGSGDSKHTAVFLIGGSSAAAMRLLSVSGQRSPSCKEIDIGGDLSSIIAEPAAAPPK
jgi:hypothetical protein